MLFLNKLGYFGVFIAGIFFVSTFTIARATIVLLGFLGSNLIILHLIKKHLARKKFSFLKIFKPKSRKKVMHSHFYHWSLPALGALIMASPLPDEIGIALLSILHMRTYQFIVVSYFLKTTGIFLILHAPLVVKI